MDVQLAEVISDSGEGVACCPLCGQMDTSFWLAAPDRFHGRKGLYHLQRCNFCSLVWTKCPPVPDEMGRHYGADYDRAIVSGGEDLSHWRDRRNTLLQYKSGGALLDLGCSSGGFLAAMRGPGWSLSGIEMSGAVAKVAQSRCNAQVFEGDILEAPYLPCSFDAITCFHLFEHVYAPKMVLQKVWEWLKPGGVFYAMMPNIDSAGARIFRSHWYALELPRHLYHFSPTSLRYVADSVNFETVSIETHREMFIEASIRYLLDSGFDKVGIKRAPMSQRGPLALPLRVLRKGIRLTILPVVTALLGTAGDGESIHIVFRKPISAKH